MTAGKHYIHFDIFRMCVNIHLFPKLEHRYFGYNEGWWNGPIYSFGLGSLLLISAAEIESTHGE